MKNQGRRGTDSAVINFRYAVCVKGVGLGGSVIVLQNIEACKFTPLWNTPLTPFVTVRYRTENTTKNSRLFYDMYYKRNHIMCFDEKFFHIVLKNHLKMKITHEKYFFHSNFLRKCIWPWGQRFQSLCCCCWIADYGTTTTSTNSKCFLVVLD